LTPAELDPIHGHVAQGKAGAGESYFSWNNRKLIRSDQAAGSCIWTAGSNSLPSAVEIPWQRNLQNVATSVAIKEKTAGAVLFSSS
jgi:hypothetical protein